MRAGAIGKESNFLVVQKLLNDFSRVNSGLERRNDEATCRVTNLPEDMPDLEEQLRDMFGQIGRIERFYLARDKSTNRLRGFAFITYESRMYAERAINHFNNAKFGHLILKVEWTKPSNN